MLDCKASVEVLSEPVVVRKPMGKVVGSELLLAPLQLLTTAITYYTLCAILVLQKKARKVTLEAAMLIHNLEPPYM